MCTVWVCVWHMTVYKKYAANPFVLVCVCVCVSKNIFEIASRLLYKLGP